MRGLVRLGLGLDPNPNPKPHQNPNPDNPTLITLGARRCAPSLDLPCISPVSPLYLAFISRRCEALRTELEHLSEEEAAAQQERYRRDIGEI